MSKVVNIWGTGKNRGNRGTKLVFFRTAYIMLNMQTDKNNLRSLYYRCVN